jgi:hypothetical protein
MELYKQTMKETFKLILVARRRGAFRVSDHGCDELADDNIFIRDVIAGASGGRRGRRYPDYQKGL